MHYSIATAAVDWLIGEMKLHCLSVYPRFVQQVDKKTIILHSPLLEEFHRFENVLMDEIYNHLVEHKHLYLSCYLTPNSILSDIAQRARISKTYFPHRISMEILNNTVQVAVNGQDLYDLPIPKVMRG